MRSSACWSAESGRSKRSVAAGVWSVMVVASRTQGAGRAAGSVIATAVRGAVEQTTTIPAPARMIYGVRVGVTPTFLGRADASSEGLDEGNQGIVRSGPRGPGGAFMCGSSLQSNYT